MLRSQGVRWLTSLLVILPFVSIVAGLLRSGAGDAQTCGTEHTVKEGETLAQIAARVYGNPTQWTVIFYANQDRLGGNISLLVPGLALRLPCIGDSQAPAPTVAPTAPVPSTAAASQAPPTESTFIISSLLNRVEFLTADGFAPYTGRALEGGGMLTHVISSAMGLIKDESKGR